MKNEIDGKYELAIELIQETIDFMVETRVPLEIIANLDIALEIFEEMNATALDDEIESDLELDVISHIGYDIIN